MMTEAVQIGRCPECEAELPAQVQPQLCPKCLLKAGLETQAGDEYADRGGRARGTEGTKGLPEPGDLFGHYRMVRLLGQGGMGVVYEAEDLETGRLIALKVLVHALDSPESRKRFLREGQLAASINHPNSVYVFGTEEIAGTPVIAMEMMAGGTLRDRVLARGPLAVEEAVEAVLQIIDGLEAAQQIGILHRDIKPSNCFLDADGTVKIGDFGLSISTAVRTESNLTETGALFGTPAFSSPEQLRGEELTVRSDIYAVGVTLYNLLTGRMPFEGANVMQLLATILEQRPESPAKWRTELPSGLCRAVLRCLEKDTGERFANYAKLREALLPYALVTPEPATLALRFLAGCVDASLLVPVLFQAGQFLDGRGWELAGTAAFYGGLVVYYAWLEGRRGVTAGKALFGLRTAGVRGNPPGVARALGRTLVFVGLSMGMVDVMGALFADWIKSPVIQGLVATAAWFGFLGLTFVTARRGNQFAGLHDLVSGTRVVSRAACVSRPRLVEEMGPGRLTDVAEKEKHAGSSKAPSPLRSAGAVQDVGGFVVDTQCLPRARDVKAELLIGPYHVLGTVGESGGAEILLGYDARLLRKVWIRKLEVGEPELAAELRRLTRPGRLRWLGGKRSETEAWDAYEAASGQPLLNLLSKRPGWKELRFWLLDLAEELHAAAQGDGLLPELSLGRVWILEDGRAKLLDFPAPGIASDSCAIDRAGTAHEFLNQVAISVLAGRPVRGTQAEEKTLAMPLPLHALSLLGWLKRQVGPGEFASKLRPVLGRISSVSRARRVALVAGALWFPILLTVSVMLPEFRKQTDGASPRGLLAAINLACVYGMSVVVVPCWIASLAFRGGALMRSFGIAVVTRDGKEATRMRLLWRNVVAWGPFAVLFGLGGVVAMNHWPIWPAPVVLAVLTLISLLLPGRSLQDRWAGTYLVPR